MKVNAYSNEYLHKLCSTSILGGLFCQFITCEIIEIRDRKYLLSHLPLSSLQHRILSSSLFPSALFTVISNSSSSGIALKLQDRLLRTLKSPVYRVAFYGTQSWDSPHLISLLLLRPPLDSEMNPFVVLESYKYFQTFSSFPGSYLAKLV